MRLYVLKPIKLKKAGRVFEVSAGSIVDILRPEKAQPLIDSGYVRPLLLPDESGKVQAARIWSDILQEEIWIITCTEALSLIPEGAVVYLSEETRNLKGATEEEIRVVHRVKKGIGGVLIAVNDTRGKA